MNRWRLPRQERMLKLPVLRRPEMPHLPVILRLQLRVAGRGRHLVVLQGGNRHKRQEMVRAGPDRMQEMRRHGRARKQMIGGRIRRGGQAAAPAPTAPAAHGQSLHALEVQAVLLQVAGHILPGQPIHTHQLHDGLGHGVLDPQVGDRIDEPLVELRRPDEARPLEGAGRLVATGAGAKLAGVGELGRAGLGGGARRGEVVGGVWRGGGWVALGAGGGGVAVRRRSDVEGESKIGSD